MLVSIVIPVKNGKKWLRESIPIFLAQKINGKLELIILDSASSDGIEVFVKQFSNVVFYSIDPASFNHGVTRNKGVNLAKGEYVIMTVQDACPTNEYWLQGLLNGFLDSDVAAVCGQQIVPHHEDKNPIEWFRPISVGGIRRVQLEQTDMEKLSPMEQRQLACIDNVNTCYRKDKLVELPFRYTPFAEDAYWAKDALQKGWAIVYTTKARVEHYHHYSNSQVYRSRLLYEHLSQYKIFGFLPLKPKQFSLKSIVRYSYTIYKSSPFTHLKNVYWVKYNFFLEKENRKAYQIWMEAYKNNNLENLFKNKIPISGQ